MGGWTFEGEGNSKVPQYFQSLFESGIQACLDFEEVTRRYARYSNYILPKREDNPIRLGDAILTLFVLWGVLICTSVVIGIVELRKILCQAVLAWIRNFKDIILASYLCRVFCAL